MKWIRPAIWTVATSTAIAAWWFLATVLFCFLARLPIRKAHPGTLVRYVVDGKPSIAVRRLVVGSGLVSFAILTIPIAYWRARGQQASPYGNARWAGSADVRLAGLLSTTGIILGKRDGRLLCMPGWEHVMCFAPSGSGKGVGIVIPNLLHWPDSAIVHDVKGENFRLTAGFRAAHGQKIYFFNPADPAGRTHRYNPFSS